MFALGIDSGSAMTKGVLFDGKQIVKTRILPTSVRPRDSMYQVYEELLPKEPCFTVTTGYGRGLLSKADKTLTEITCHAKGAAFLCPKIQGLIDIGGQDCKVIRLDREKNVMDFLMNDKCAAGTGRFVEMMMKTLEIPEAELDAFIQGAKPVKMNSMCTVFAESEIVSLLAQGEQAKDIALGVIESICKRTANFSKRISLEGSVYFSGGLARHPVFRNMLEEFLQQPVVTHPMGQFTGALGAAVVGWQKYSNSIL